jgi:hypothetical protein
VTNLIDAAKSGNKRDTLVALRDILAGTIQNCESGRDMASNSKRLMEVIAEIEAIDEAEAQKQQAAQQKISKHNRLKKKIEER